MVFPEFLDIWKAENGKKGKKTKRAKTQRSQRGFLYIYIYICVYARAGTSGILTLIYTTGLLFFELTFAGTV